MKLWPIGLSHLLCCLGEDPSQRTASLIVEHLSSVATIGRLGNCFSDDMSCAKNVNNKAFDKGKDFPREVPTSDGQQDVTFIMDDGKRILVCKNILAQHSEVFSAMFHGGYKESGQAEICLPGASSIAFQTMVDVLGGGDLSDILRERKFPDQKGPSAENSMCPADGLAWDILVDMLILSHQYLVRKLESHLLLLFTQILKGQLCPCLCPVATTSDNCAKLIAAMVSELTTVAVAHDSGSWLSKRCVRYLLDKRQPLHVRVETIIKAGQRTVQDVEAVFRRFLGIPQEHK